MRSLRPALVIGAVSLGAAAFAASQTVGDARCAADSQKRNARLLSIQHDLRGMKEALPSEDRSVRNDLTELAALWFERMSSIDDLCYLAANVRDDADRTLVGS